MPNFLNLALYLGLASAASVHRRILQSNYPRDSASNASCPVILDGRIPISATLKSFDNSNTSSFVSTAVKGENITWSQILLFPNNTPPALFDVPGTHKPFEVTIDDRSLFKPGGASGRVQTAFRRAGLIMKDDLNNPGADASDNGTVTFHWSIMQDPQRPLNFTHEYMNVWHEKADFSGNQFMFVGGLVLEGDGGNGINTKEEREKWRIQDFNKKFVFETPILFDSWQNFAVQMDYVKNTIRVFYSAGDEPLKAVTEATPNENGGGGQLQVGILKKPTETKTALFDGFQEPIPIQGEGQIYSGIFVEDSNGGCISL